MKNNIIRLLLTDDHPVVREGLAALIQRQTDMQVVAEAGDGQQAVELFRLHRPDLTLMDLRMPRLNGVEAIQLIRRQFSEALIIVLSTYDGDEEIYRALRAGARGYLLKDMFREDLLAAIRTVHGGRRYIPTVVAARLAERIPGNELTIREVEILRLIVKGRSNKEIANVFDITEGTVKGHVNSILGKLGVSHRTAAATTALQRGIVYSE